MDTTEVDGVFRDIQLVQDVLTKCITWGASVLKRKALTKTVRDSV